jgi:hypothetical protein
MAEPKYKDHQLIVYNGIPTSGDISMFINTQGPVDKIRITCADQSFLLNPTPGLTIWSDIVNNYIGTLCTEYSADTYYFTSSIQPQNGIEFWYPHKITLNGNYNFRFRDLQGNPPGANFGVLAFILVEWFIY